MRPFPLLLRVLLCLAFVVYGVAGAQAGVRMALASPPATTAHTVEAHAMPCHGDADAATPAHRADLPTAGHGDCCKDGRCDCTCAPSMLQSMGVARVAAVDAPAATVAPPPVRTHRPPRLPHLIRPPIG